MDENNGDAPLKSSLIDEMSRPATQSTVPEIVEFVTNIEKQEGFSNERTEEIAKAIREALNVVITKAYGEKGGEVKIQCKHDAWGKLVIVISERDPGQHPAFGACIPGRGAARRPDPAHIRAGNQEDDR